MSNSTTSISVLSSIDSCDLDGVTGGRGAAAGMLGRALGRLVQSLTRQSSGEVASSLGTAAGDAITSQSQQPQPQPQP